MQVAWQLLSTPQQRKPCRRYHQRAVNYKADGTVEWRCSALFNNHEEPEKELLMHRVKKNIFFSGNFRCRLDKKPPAVLIGF